MKEAALTKSASAACDNCCSAWVRVWVSVFSSAYSQSTICAKDAVKLGQVYLVKASR